MSFKEEIIKQTYEKRNRKDKTSADKIVKKLKKEIRKASLKGDFSVDESFKIPFTKTLRWEVENKVKKELGFDDVSVFPSRVRDDGFLFIGYSDGIEVTIRWDFDEEKIHKIGEYIKEKIGKYLSETEELQGRIVIKLDRFNPITEKEFYHIDHNFIQFASTEYRLFAKCVSWDKDDNVIVGTGFIKEADGVDLQKEKI